MYSNGPVSIRRDCTVCVAGSGQRSETHEYTLPSSSGCVVSRKTIRPGSSSITSTLAYSVNRRGQSRTSLVTRQTKSSGASMRISLSVCPVITRLLTRDLGDAGVDHREDLVRGEVVAGCQRQLHIRTTRLAQTG